MRVRQLTGRLAGQIVEMPHTVGEACLAAGTAALPDEEVRMRGLAVPAGGDSIGGDADIDTLSPNASDGGENGNENTSVEVPEDWAELHHMKLKKLATEIAGSPVDTKPDAVRIIEAYLDTANEEDGSGTKNDAGGSSEDGTTGE